MTGPAAATAPANPSRPTRRRWERLTASLPVYPTGLAVAICFQAVVVTGSWIGSAGRALVVSAIAGILLTLICSIALRDRHRAGIVAALAVALIALGNDFRVAGLTILAIGLVTVVAPRFVPDFRFWQSISRGLGVATVILWLALGIHAFQNGDLALPDTTRASAAEAPAPLVDPGVGEVPDVVLVMLDGYARADVLRDTLGFDNSSFIAGLRDRGFDVAEQSRSNYPITMQSMASIFQMRPLHDIPALGPLLAGTETRPVGTVISTVINDGIGLELFRQSGYETVSISGGYQEPTLRSVDNFIDTGQVNEFELNIVGRSPLAAGLRVLAPDLMSSQYRDRIEAVFREATAQITGAHERPRFLFAHVPSPHPPWVFRADGSPRTTADIKLLMAEGPQHTGLSVEESIDAYVGQLSWLNGRIKRFLDATIGGAARPAIVAIFSDHGTFIGVDGPEYRERFRNLTAIRTPDESQIVDDTVALVDLLPIVLEDATGLVYPRHPSTPSYMSRPGAIFDLFPVPDVEDGAGAGTSTP